jgi:glyoxylase-like metal-dependent hydrolase (beta-lactamase superfamily II)
MQQRITVRPPPIAVPAPSPRIHHLNCVSACPLGGLLIDGMTRRSRRLALAKSDLRARLTSHCLLVEAPDGLVLIDTGYGLRDVASPRSRLHPFFLDLLRPELDEEMTAIRQIQRLGFRAHDVRHVVLTHLDFDHAGGLDDFPTATVHLLREEVLSATAQSTRLDRMRYRPQQWGNRDRWRAYEPSEGDQWMGFTCVRDLSGLDAEVLLVPLVGHTLGHAGIAVRRDQGWLFFAGDAYFHRGEMDVEHPHCTPGLALYQRMMDKDRRKRFANQARLRELRRNTGDEVEIFCAHDATEFVRLAGRSHLEPAPMHHAPRATLSS